MKCELYLFVWFIIVPFTKGADDCLEPDSKEPKCDEWVQDVNGEPIFIEHVFNCSRFWVCEPSLKPCLFECAPMFPTGSLYFDVRYQYPEGPVCDYPFAVDCTNTSPECGQCEAWQECITGANGEIICTPYCRIDTHCQDNEYCACGKASCHIDDIGEEGTCVEGCRNGAACGENVKPCGNCVDHECIGEPECCTNADCETGYECINGTCELAGCLTDSDCAAGEYCEDTLCLAGCNEDSDCEGTSCSTCTMASHTCFDPECCSNSDCTEPGQTCEAGACKYECLTDPDCETNPDKPLCSDDHLCVSGCREDDDCDGYNLVCNIPGYDNCNYCDAAGITIGSCNPGCVDDTNCPGVCNSDHQCECVTDDDCNANEYCDGGQCTEVECNEDPDCTDPDKPLCSNDHFCVSGCRENEDCIGYNNVCDNLYSNCNYCNATIDMTLGTCNPGCITDSNCADPMECYVDHVCKDPPSFLSLKQIIFDTATCDDCQGTNVEDGPKLQIIGGEGKDGTPMCDTEGLDHADRVDFATGSQAVFDDKDDKEVLGACYRADLLGEVTGGSITWTAATGSWRLNGDQVDFTWSNADQCKYSCCLDNPTLSAAAPTANLVNCKKNCGDNLVC